MKNIKTAQSQLLGALRSQDPRLSVRWSEERGVAAVLKGRLLTWGSKETPEQLLGKCLRKFGPLIGPTNVLDNYEYVETTTSKGRHSRIRGLQKAGGFPIYGATIILFADRKRGIFRIQSGFYRDAKAPPARLGAKRVSFSARETGLVKRLKKRLEADAEGARFAKRRPAAKGIGLTADWAEANFPLTKPPKLWLYPTKQGLRQVFRVSAYQPIKWSDAAGNVRKAVDVADMWIDARTGRIIDESARLGMAYSDTTGDGHSTLEDSGGTLITRPLLVVQEDGGDRLLINRTHTPHIMTHDADGTGDMNQLENMFKNDTHISRDADGHWDQTTASCTTSVRQAAQQPETDGHFFANLAWEFYNSLGWRGFDDGGWGTHCPVRVAAHIGTGANAYFWYYIYGGKYYGYVAFYDGTCSGGSIAFDFCAGDPAIFAHEFQHGVTFFGARAPNGDPGYLETTGWHRAIHEGLSDSMAGLRTGLWVTPGLWRSGITRNAQPFRRIVFPRSTATDGNDAYCDHYDDRNISSDAYYRSTMLSHAAFLAGQGGVHQRTSRPAELIPVVGVGRERIAEIFHYAVTEYFDNIPANSTGGHTMIEAANFILDAAEDVTGSDRTCEYVMLRRAFYAVGLYPYDDSYNKAKYGGEACMLPWTIAWRHSRPYLGFPALWYKSPDLFINNGSGAEYDAVVGQVNKLFARVRNVGDENLTKVQVHFLFRAHGTNLPPPSTQWKPCRDQNGDPCILDIPTLTAGSMNFTDVNNPPASQAVDWYLSPAEIVQGIDHFCVRAVIECASPNHDNDCPNYVQSNISYTQWTWAEGRELVFMVANWGRKPIPLDLQVEHTLPKWINLEYTGRRPLKEIRVRSREEIPLSWRFTITARPPRHQSPPYDGKVIAKVKSGQITGGLEGTLSEVKVPKKGPQRRPSKGFVAIEGMLSGTIDEKARIAGQFHGELELKTGILTGRLTGDVYVGRRQPLRDVRLTLKGYLEPLRAVHFTQLVKGEPVGGVTVYLKLPRLSGQFKPEEAL